MKWMNKGHEFDPMFEAISKKDSFYLFGAGDYGNLFFQIIDGIIRIDGYIDNDLKKIGSTVNGLPCYSLSAIEKKVEIGIIVTMSQIARVKPIEQLTAAGYIRNIDFFIIEEFLSVYFVYEKNMVYFSSISFLPSTICNLNCRYCLNFNPFAKSFFKRKWDDVIRDIDLFFECVDRIMLFHVSGGEPLLYEHTADLICYLHKNYGNRIDTLRTVTNGTVVPKDEILHKLSECDFEITIDDYREAVPQYEKNFDELIKKLESFNIKYYVNKASGWIDLAPEKTDFSDKDEGWIISHRNSCSQSWQELREGKLYSCNYAAYATVAGIIGEDDKEECYDLSNYTPSKRKELVEFRLGYTSKGYTEFCKKCRGFTVTNSDIRIPAEQINNRN